MTNYDYQEALKNAAKSMVRVKNPHRLLKMIARFVASEVHLSHASILIYDHFKDRYIFVDSKGSRRIPINLIKLDASNPLIRWFSKKESKLKEANPVRMAKTPMTMINSMRVYAFFINF